MSRLVRVELPRAEAAASATESFFIEAKDVLAATRLDSGLASMVLVHDAGGEVVGYASELGVPPEAEWTVVLPGRGTLFLHRAGAASGTIAGGTGEFADAAGALEEHRRSGGKVELHITREAR